MRNENYVNSNNESVKLLRECDAGAKMGISSIEDVIGDVKSTKMKNLLNDSRAQHQELESELRSLLSDHNDEGKAPNPMAKGMSKIKTNVMMMANPSDQTIANIMTDGCNMGIKSVNKYLNQYQNADKDSRNVAEKLVKIESQLHDDLAQFL